MLINNTGGIKFGTQTDTKIIQMRVADKNTETTKYLGQIWSLQYSQLDNIYYGTRQ